MQVSLHVTPSQWHAHEMFYGYVLAIIAGFLLTAVRNWTNVPTAHGKTLAALFGLWGAARLCMALPNAYWQLAACRSRRSARLGCRMIWHAASAWR